VIFVRLDTFFSFFFSFSFFFLFKFFHFGGNSGDEPERMSPVHRNIMFRPGSRK
jgi:hypothetical protein